MCVCTFNGERLPHSEQFAVGVDRNLKVQQGLVHDERIQSRRICPSPPTTHNTTTVREANFFFPSSSLSSNFFFPPFHLIYLDNLLTPLEPVQEPLYLGAAVIALCHLYGWEGWGGMRLTAF